MTRVVMAGAALLTLGGVFWWLSRAWRELRSILP